MKQITIEPPITARNTRRTAGIAALVAVAMLVIWTTGVFDTWLAPAGLNYKDCVRNRLTGAVFCGSEAKWYEQHHLVTP